MLNITEASIENMYITKYDSNTSCRLIIDIFVTDPIHAEQYKQFIQGEAFLSNFYLFEILE